MLDADMNRDPPGDVAADEAAAGPPVGGSEEELVAVAKVLPRYFGELYELHYSRILNYAYRRTLNVTAAEEVTSATFFKALRSLPKYKHRGEFSAWLYRIATNEIRLHRRLQRRRREGDPAWQEELNRVRFASGRATTAEGPEEIEARMGEFALLHQALDRLPEKYQTVIALRYFEAMPHSEIADVLGKKLGTVKSLIHRGLERLRRQFERDGMTFPATLRQEEGKEE